MARIARGVITLTDIKDGDQGIAGARNAVRYLYKETTSDTAPDAPQATITWSTGSLSDITTGWSEGPPEVDATGTGRPWVSALTFHQASSSSQAATTTVTGSTPKKGFTFDGVVTFSNNNLTDGTNTYDPAAVVNSGTTTIDGGKITANSITSDEILVDNLAAISANLGDITAGTIDAGTVTINNLSVGSSSLPDNLATLNDTKNIAVLINEDLTTTNVGEAILVGYTNGSIDKAVDGFITYKGQKYDIQRVDGQRFVIMTTVANKSGYIVYDSAGTQKFDTGFGVQDNYNIGFVWFDGTNWRYDNNSAADGVIFTPADTDLALGIMSTSSSDLIASAELFFEVVKLTDAAEKGTTVSYGNPLEDLSDINVTEGTKLTGIESGATNTGGEWFKLIDVPDAQEPISGDSATFTTTFTSNFSRAPKYGDIVLVEFATLSKKTYQYTNGWNEPSAVILGDMLVKGTVRADRVDVIGSEATVIIDGDNETPLVIENTTSGDYFKVKTGGRIEASDGIFEDGGVSLDKINQAELNAYVSQRLSEVGTFTAGIDETFTDTITLTSPDTVCVVGTALDASVDHTVEFRLQDSWAHSLVDITETAANGGPTGDLNIGYDIQGSTNGTSGWTSIDSGTAVADSVVIEGDTNGGGSTTEPKAYDPGNYEWTLNYTYEDSFGGGGYFVDLVVKWNGATVYYSSIYGGGTKESNPNWTRTSVTVGENTYNRGNYDSNSGTSNVGSFYYGLTRVGSSTVTNGLETFTLNLIRSINPTTDYPYYRAVLTGFSNTDTFNGTTPTGGGSGAVAFDGVPSLRVYTAGSSAIFSAGDISVTTGAASGGGSLSYNDAGEFTFAPANLSGKADTSGDTFTGLLRVEGQGAALATEPFKHLYVTNDGMQIKGTESVLDIVGADSGGHSSSILLRNENSGFTFINAPNEDSLVLKSFTATADNFYPHSASGVSVDNLNKLAQFNKDQSVGLFGPLNIQKLGNTAQDTTLLTLTNSNVLGDLDNQETFIDFSFIDSNENFTPQVRIGANVGQSDGDSDSQIKEGSGAFVVYTATGTGAATGTLSEKFRVQHDGVLKAGSETIYHSGNFTPADKADLSGATFTGTVISTKSTIGSIGGAPTISNASFLAGTTTTGLGIDSNEIVYVGTGTSYLNVVHDAGFEIHTGAGTENNAKRLTVNNDGIQVSGTISATGYNKSNWDTAYGWGNHADAGYLTVESYENLQQLTFNVNQDDSATSSNYNIQGVKYSNGRILAVQNITGYTGNSTEFRWRFRDLGEASPSSQTLMSLTPTAFDSADLDVSGSITATGYNDSNWNTAYGWGNHADAGYLTSHQDISGKANLSGDAFTGNISINGVTSNIARLSLNEGGIVNPDNVIFEYDGTGSGDTNYFHIYSEVDGWMTKGSSLNIQPSTGKVDIGATTFTEKFNVDGNVNFTGTITASGYNDSNWNTAYGWGDHSTQGYLTSVPAEYLTQTEGDARYHALSGSDLYKSATYPTNTFIKQSSETEYTGLTVASVGGVGVILDTNNNDASDFIVAHGTTDIDTATKLFDVNGAGQGATIYLDAETSRAPVGLTLHSTVADIAGNGYTDGNFIDFKVTDANATFTPQARIGMLVKDYSGDSGVLSEGAGNFTISVGQGTDASGNGTLKEALVIREDNLIATGTNYSFTAYGNILSSYGNITASNGYVKSGSGGFYVSDNQVIDSARNATFVDGAFTGGVEIAGANGAIGSEPFTYSYATGTSLLVKGNESSIDIVGSDAGNHGSSLLLRNVNEGFGFINDPANDRLELKSFTVTDNNFQVHATGSNVDELTTLATFNKSGTVDFGGVISTTGGNSTEWNTGYDYSQVGHLPLSGGTLTGNLTLNSATPEILFNGTSDAGVDMAIKATPEGLDFYEPEDVNKIHFQILDDTGVNAPFGYNVGTTQVIDSSGNVKKSPTLTLSGDVSGTATFTDLGNATLTATVANDSHTHDGRYYTEAESDDRFARVYKGTATINTSYTTVATVSGDRLASSIDMTIQGTSGNVVINVDAKILVNHSQDILIKTESGIYTQIQIKVTSNNNESYAIEVARVGGSGDTGVAIEIFPRNSETVTFTSSHSFTGSSLNHQTYVGTKQTATGGGAYHLVTDGNISSQTYEIDGTTVIDSSRNLTSITNIGASGAVTANGFNVSTLGGITQAQGEFGIGSGNVGIHFNDSGDNLLPFNHGTLAFSNGVIDFGHESYRYKDGFFSGKISVSALEVYGNSIKFANLNDSITFEDTGNVYSFNTDAGTGNAPVRAGSYQVGTTTVIDSSRNADFVDGTFTGNLDVITGGASGQIRVGRTSNQSLLLNVNDRTALIEHTQDETTGEHIMQFNINSPTALANKSFDFTNGSIKVGGTTVIDSSRNATFAGLTSSGTTSFTVTGITDLNSVPNSSSNTFVPFISEFQATNRSGSNYNGGFWVGARASGYGSQMTFQANGATTPPYVRNLAGGTWGDWQKILTNKNPIESTTDANHKWYTATTNTGSGVVHEFSDQVPTTQKGYFKYFHSDTRSHGSGNVFTLTSNTTSLSFAVDGKVIGTSFHVGFNSSNSGTQIVDSARNAYFQSLRLTSGENIEWGGAYSSGYPTIASSGNGAAGFTAFYPTGNTDGEVARLNSAGFNVTGDIKASGDIIASGATPWVVIENTEETASGIIFNDLQAGTYPAASSQRFQMSWSSGDNVFRMGHDNDTDQFTLTTAGNVSITGNMTAYGSSSDARLKDNVKNIDDALNKVSKLNGVTFNYKGDDNQSTGLIAQDLLEVLPEVVYETEDEYYAVRYGNVVGLLVEAIKELKTEIEELKNGTNSN